MVAAAVLPPTTALASWDQRESSPAGVRFSSELVCQMHRHPLHVLHQRRWILEDVMIDALQNVANLGSGLVKHNRVGVIDVARPVRFRSQILSVEGELSCDPAEIVAII